MTRPVKTVRRALRYHDAQGERRLIDQSEVLNFLGPRIILGEPGQGKSVLLKALAEEAGLTLITAKQLLRTHAIGELSQPLVIDALDEVVSARDFDAVQQILAKLAMLGRPQFLLSCRAADWEGAVASADIEQDYGLPPTLFWLEPLSRSDATTFLEDVPQVDDPGALLGDLESRGMAGLYENPLTLTLFADTIAKGGQIPESRAALIAAACDLLWREHAVQHTRSLLNGLTAREALLAAGALCAVQILTGADALSTKPFTQIDEGDRAVRVVTKLPYGASAMAVLGSRLFVNVGTGRFAPLHRVIAEFLGGQWLARLIDDGVSEARIFAMLTLGNTVPSSLRGLHAWMAAFSDRAARRAIVDDPYGILRYGDAGRLSDARVRDLLDALERLAKVDPFFRASDWGRSSAKDMARLSVAPDIERLLTTSDNFHLRKLILELLKGTQLAITMQPLLYRMMLDPAETFAERAEAAEALQGVLPATQWPSIIETLRCFADADSTRLAVEILTDLGVEPFDDQILVETVLAFLGYTLCPAEGPNVERAPIGVVSLFNMKVPAERAAALLDMVAEYVSIKAIEDNWERRWELANFTSSLFMQAVAEDQPTPTPDQFWRWLQLLDPHHGRSRSERASIENYFKAHVDERRAVQRHVLRELSIEDTLWMRAYRLGDTLSALTVTAEDALVLLEELNDLTDRSGPVRDAWRDLVQITRSREGISREHRAVARVFAKGDRELLQFLDKATKPISNKWERQSEARRKKEEVRKSREFAVHRADFLAHRDELEAGELRWIVPAARSYLAMFHGSDRDQQPLTRVATWLGDELAGSVVIGLEAVLRRDDLPTSADVIQGFADQRTWNMTYAMVAALGERLRHGRSLSDLPRELLRTVWLMLQHESYLSDQAKLETFISDVEVYLGADPAAFAEDYRLLIEPGLAAPVEHVRGLYRLGRDKHLLGIGKKLALEWLAKFTGMHVNSEAELVDLLLGQVDPDALRPIVEQRLSADLREDRLLLWLAIAFVVDFEAQSDQLDAAATRHPALLWNIRNRLRSGRDERDIDVSAEQNGWIIAQFRGVWPQTPRPNSVTSGDSNAWDATDFLQGRINRLAADTSFAATDALTALRSAPTDSYTNYIRHAAARQRRTRDEAQFEAVTVEALSAIVTEASPATIDDLQAVLLDALSTVQSKLRASETNPLAAFYDSTGTPQNENFCRDRLVEWVSRELPRSVTQATEVRMPDDKRSDIAFVQGDLVVPVEVKAQWHTAVYDAAISQLNRLYAKEWRAHGRGIYVVLWFGAVDVAGKRLTRPPNKAERPASAAALAAVLIERIPEAHRGRLAVRVIDLSR